MPKTEPTSRPGAHWYITGAVLIIMGPIALGWSLWTGSMIRGNINQSFTAPGNATVLITDPGDYTLWRMLDLESAPPIPTGIRIMIVEPTLGSEYELEPQLGALERTDERFRVAIARTSLPRKGPYEIVIEGEFPTGEFEFGSSTGSEFTQSGFVTPKAPNRFGASLYTISTILFGSISVIGFISGGAIIVYVWIARDRSPETDQGQA